MRSQSRAALDRGLFVALACAILGSASGCLERGPLAPPTLEPLRIHTDGAWLRDRNERVVLLRGVTYSVTERDVDFGGFDGGGERTLARLESLGLNVVRLPLSWALLEPRPGRHHPEYLTHKVNPVVRLAAAHGLAVVLSMRPWPRQDCTHPDPTIPDWVCAAIEREGGDGCAFWRATDPRGTLVRNLYARSWALIAREYNHDARVIGFDVLDEPAPGRCFDPDDFFATALAPYYQKLSRAVRAMDAPQALLVEPPTSWPAQSDIAFDLDGPLVFSPHVWPARTGPPAGRSVPSAYTDAQAAAKGLGAPLFVGFGANLPPGPDGVRGSSSSFVVGAFDQLDRLLASGAFDTLRPRTPYEPAASLGPLEEAFARPFARRIAGLPEAMRFDRPARTFHLRFRDDPIRTPSDPTEIFLPEVPFGDDFEVTMEPPGHFRFDAHTRRLLIYRGDGASHDVEVRAQGALTPGTRVR